MRRLLVVNGVSLDFATAEKPFSPQHDAFLVTEEEFDSIFARIQARHLQFWADLACRKAGEINHNDGGRGGYFKDPCDHLLELITRPYGSQSHMAR